MDLPRTYSGLNRLREIALTLARHGFSHVLSQMRLFEHVPGLSRLRPVRSAEDAVSRSVVPERLVLVMQDLGATFIKFGQLIATRPDFVPADYLQAFQRLQDNVAPCETPEIRKVVEARLGRPVDDVFSSFDDVPLASGSIGQVHGARLHDGTHVVVKVKRPGTDERVREDLDLLRLLADLLEKHVPETRVFRPSVLVDEFARVMKDELDFVCEAAHTEKFRAQFAEDAGLAIPRVYWDYSSPDTLVLERMRGTPLTALDKLRASGRNLSEIAERLARCFLTQFFVSGQFHADPHEGNFILLDDGRLALIDFGQMGNLSEQLRQHLSMGLFALVEGDADFLVDVYCEIGAVSGETNLREFKSEFSSLMTRYYGLPASRIRLGQAFYDATSLARRHGLLLPRDFVMLVKSLATVFGVIQKLDPSFAADKALRPFCGKLAGHLLSPRPLSRRFGFYLYRIFSMLRRAPDDLRDLLEKAKGGQTRIIFHHEGLDEVAMQFERASNRLTVGLIVAALMVGSSILLAAGPQAFGHLMIPLPGTAQLPLSIAVAASGFVGAMSIGLWLAWGIFRSHRL